MRERGEGKGADDLSGGDETEKGGSARRRSAR